MKDDTLAEQAEGGSTVHLSFEHLNLKLHSMTPEL
jgi:hypothetical protein